LPTILENYLEEQVGVAKRAKGAEEFHSFSAWRDNYFPDDLKSERISVLKSNSKDLGVALANSTFDRLLANRAKGKTVENRRRA